MSLNIHIDITIKAWSARNNLADGERLFAQLMVDGTIIERTEPVGKDPEQFLWKLEKVLKV